MANINHDQAGFEMIGVMVVVAVVTVIGFVGYKVTSRQSNAAQPASSTAEAVKVPATISTKADLAQTSKALDNSGAQVDSQVNGNQLDNDINDLL